MMKDEKGSMSGWLGYQRNIRVARQTKESKFMGITSRTATSAVRGYPDIISRAN